MRRRKFLGIVGGTVAALLLAAPGSAADRPTAQQLLPHDASFCFGRIYDAAHLARNTKQQVVLLRIGARAGWNVREQRDLPYHDITIALSVRTKAGGPTQLVLGYCSDYEETNEVGAERGLNCDLICKGDKLIIDALDANTIVVRNRGMRASCRGPRIGGEADAVFQLHRQSLAACSDLATLPASEEGIQRARIRAQGQR